MLKRSGKGLCIIFAAVFSDVSSSHQLVCVTSAFVDDDVRRRRSVPSMRGRAPTTPQSVSLPIATLDVTVLIDAAVLTSPRAVFSYYNDPVITNVYPRKSIVR